MDLRQLPQLKFTLDNSIEYSVHISEILEGLKLDSKKEGDGE